MKKLFWIPLVALFLVTMLTGFAFAAGATFVWTPNSETNLAGYKIYSGSATGSYMSTNDVGTAEIVDGKVVATLTGFVPGNTYYFAATAYNIDGFESDFSLEVVWVVPVEEELPPVAENPPAAPDFGSSPSLMVFPAKRNADGTYSTILDSGVVVVTVPPE